MSAKEIGPKERWLREMREANMNGRKAAKPSSKELVERVAKVVKKPGKKRRGKK